MLSSEAAFERETKKSEGKTINFSRRRLMRRRENDAKRMCTHKNSSHRLAKCDKNCSPCAVVLVEGEELDGKR
jgi:hypothetical protein